MLVETLAHYDQVIDQELLNLVYQDDQGYLERLNGLVYGASFYFSQPHRCLFQRLALEFKGQTNRFTSIIEEYNNKWRDALLYLCTPLYGRIEGKKNANEIYEQIIGKAMVKAYFEPLISINEEEGVAQSN